MQRLAQLVEQARVLDRDDGLRGEARQQLDLLVAKGPDFLPEDGDRADQHIVLEHRHANGRSRAAERRCPAGGDLPGVVNGVAHLPYSHDPIGRAARYRSIRPALGLEPFGKGRRYVVHRAHPQRPILMEIEHAELGFADARGVLQDCLENGFQVAWRRADDLEHLRSCGLTLDRLIKLAHEPRDLGGRAARWGVRSGRGLGRPATLWRCLAASRFTRLATCFGAPRHRLSP